MATTKLPSPSPPHPIDQVNDELHAMLKLIGAIPYSDRTHLEHMLHAKVLSLRELINQLPDISESQGQSHVDLIRTIAEEVRVNGWNRSPATPQTSKPTALELSAAELTANAKKAINDELARSVNERRPYNDHRAVQELLGDCNWHAAKRLIGQWQPIQSKRKRPHKSR